MKKYLIAFTILAFLSIEGFAQDGPMLINAPREYQPVDPSFGIWNSMITNSNKSLLNKPNKSSKKPKPRINRVHLIAIENTTDEATGLTTIRWNNGAVYVGEIDHGEISGTGTMIYADSSKYQGQWKNDRFHGVGTIEYADGSAYCGQWENGNPNGQGTFLTSEGIKYTAKFKDGVPRGKCILQDLDGRKYTARWVRGVLKEKSIKPLEEDK